jgi:hypothetical protein
LAGSRPQARYTVLPALASLRSLPAFSAAAPSSAAAPAAAAMPNAPRTEAKTAPNRIIATPLGAFLDLLGSGAGGAALVGAFAELGLGAGAVGSERLGDARGDLADPAGADGGGDRVEEPQFLDQVPHMISQEPPPWAVNGGGDAG